MYSREFLLCCCSYLKGESEKQTHLCWTVGPSGCRTNGLSDYSYLRSQNVWFKKKHRHPLMLNGRPVNLMINIFSQTKDLKLWFKAKKNLYQKVNILCFHKESVNTRTNVQNSFSFRFLLLTVYVFENIVIMIPTWMDFFPWVF